MTRPCVESRDLGVGYHHETVVADVQFRLEAGQVLALVGSNRSGKTTLLKTVAGLLPPTAGSLEVFGAPPLGRPERVAYLGQFHPASFMLPLRVKDVVRMARFARLGLFGRFTGGDRRAVDQAMAVMDVPGLADTP